MYTLTAHFSSDHPVQVGIFMGFPGLHRHQIPEDEDQDVSRNIGFLQLIAREGFIELSYHKSYRSCILLCSLNFEEILEIFYVNNWDGEISNFQLKFHIENFCKCYVYNI